MIIGLNVPNYGPLGTREAMTTIARHAEELGFASLRTSDHVLLPADDPGPYGHLLETVTSLTRLAAHTRRIRFATGILVLPQRDSLLVAKQAATLHHLAGGRLTLCVAAGWAEREFDLLGADSTTRARSQMSSSPPFARCSSSRTPRTRANTSPSGRCGSRPAREPTPDRRRRKRPGRVTAARARRRMVRAPAQPRQVRDAVAALGARARTPFRIVVRAQTHDGEDLRGRVDQFAAAGVDDLVVEPVTDDLTESFTVLERVLAP
jgi:hypothetical protein